MKIEKKERDKMRTAAPLLGEPACTELRRCLDALDEAEAGEVETSGMLRELVSTNRELSQQLVEMGRASNELTRQMLEVLAARGER